MDRTLHIRVAQHPLIYLSTDRVALHFANMALVLKCSFSTLKLYFQNHFLDAPTCNSESGTSAADTACLAGLIYEYITLVACPALSCKNTPVQSLAWLLLVSLVPLPLQTYGD